MYPNLKLQMWRTGMRQNRLAKMLHIEETMLSKIVNGFRPASPELRNRISVVLTADEQWLFQEAEDGFRDVPARPCQPTPRPSNR